LALFFLIVISIYIYSLLNVRPEFDYKSTDDGRLDQRIPYELFNKNKYLRTQVLDRINYRQAKCEQCNVETHELHWYVFRDAKEDWNHLAGCAGYYAKCPICQQKVESIFTVIS
jgi:hypothetical protein